MARHQERRTQENNTQHEREQEEMQRTKETLDKQVRARKNRGYTTVKGLTPPFFFFLGIIPSPFVSPPQHDRLVTDKQAWALEQHEHDTRLTALQTSLEQKYKTLEHKEHEFRQTMMQEQQALRGEFDDD